jgi:hypothetical protein
VFLSILLRIRTVDILEPNRLHIRNQHDRRGSTRNSFSRKVTSSQVTEEKVTPLMLFYGEILHYRVYSLIDGDRITLGLTQFLLYDWPLTHEQQNRPK